MSFSLLQPSFFMSKTRSYAYILIGFQLFLTAMAIHLSLRVAPPYLQQGGNSRILYVHHPIFLRSSRTDTEISVFSTFFTVVTGAFWERPMWGTFWVWDARLTSVLILFLIYLGALRFQKLSVELASISIYVGPIDIITISRSGTSIHVSMLIPILSNFANSPFFTLFFFVLETRLLILSFLESSLTEEIEARECMNK
ncbi:hypothetical protein MKW94_026366 [Papaver nudicaule]|uniref:Cytochrome c assembly protein domain-containing protein n=1 Tax=Papaver nudicaule TaxID=74823 RepID=A0AA41VW16_PAPNU|nr:hypothetical protein [Papaver nudicaule]